jgi:ankyrin repeat protein
LSAERGHRQPDARATDLAAVLALADWDTAARLLRDCPTLIGGNGLLHLMAKRGDPAAVRWLLDHGADPNARWAHWDAEVTPLHLATWGANAEVVRLLLEAGADPALRDSKFDSDAMGWAEHFERPAIVALLHARMQKPGNA